jgi:Ca-activated chloride channel family protein
MTFGLPVALLALLLVPVAVGLYLLAQRRRSAYTVRFTNLALLGQVAPRGPGLRRHIPAGLFLLALTALIVSFSRPQAVITIPKDRSQVMLVIDTSGSMQATDVQPTRLDAARNAAHALIDSLPGNASVGLIGFSATAYVVAPLTGDHGAVIDSLQYLQARGGTAIGDGLNLALDQLGVTATGSQSRPPSMVVLLTDGVSNAGAAPQDAADRAAAAHIPVETIGIGTRNGGVFVRGQDVGGVDEQALQAIAQTTSGKYFFAVEAGQLQSIYSTLGGQFGWRQQRVDLTVPMVLGGTLILVAGAALSLRWFRLLP